MNSKASATFPVIKRFVWLGLGLAGLYVSTYLLLSVCGQYRPIGMGCLHEWEESSFWAPAGFRLEGKQSGPLRRGIMNCFYPLWIADVRWVHSRKDVYWRGFRAENGEWTYETNSWTRDVKGEWIFTNFQPARATSR